MAWDDGAISGTPAPKAENAWKYRMNQLNMGAADTIGGVLDAGPRLVNLGVASYGMGPVPSILSTLTGKPKSQFIPDLPLPSDASTEFLQRLVANPEMQRPQEVGPIESMAWRGAGAAGASPVSGMGNFVKNVASGALAGAGAGVAMKHFPDSPTAALVGGLIGGVAIPAVGGSIGIAKRALDEARNAAGNVEPRTIAGKLIDRQMTQSVAGTPNAADNIDEALRLKQKFGPDFQPSIAQMSGSEGAAELQRRYATLSPEILNAELSKVEQSRAAIQAALDSRKTQTSPSVARTDVNQALAAQQGRAVAKAADVVDQLPVTNQQAIGNRAAEIAAEAKKSAQGTVTANYEKAFNAAGEEKVIPLNSVIAQVEDILGTKLSQVKPENAPATARRLLDLVRPKDAMSDEAAALRASEVGGNVVETSADRMMVSLRDADSIRRAINQDISSAGRSVDPTAAMKLRNLSKIHSTLDDVVINSNIPDQAKGLYKDALAKYRTDYVPRFKEGTNLRMFRDSSLNEPRITPDKFASEYFKSDSQAGMTRAQQFGKLFAGNKEAIDLAKKGITDLYRSDVVNPQNGLIDIAKHNRFMQEHGRTLAQWKAQGVNVVDDFGAIGSKAAAANEGIDAVSNTAKYLKYDTPEDLANAAIKSPKVMAQTLSRLTPKGRDSLRDMLVDKAWGDGSSANMSKFLADNEKTLKMALPAKHIDDLKDISKGLEIIERSPITGRLQTGGPDVVKNETGVSMATIYSQGRATSGGRQGAMTMAFNLAAPILTRLSRLKFQDAMHAALYDEKTAKHLRDLLNASNAGQANFAGAALDTAVNAWNASKGPLARILGAGNVMPQLERSAPAIMSGTQEANKNQQQ